MCSKDEATRGRCKEIVKRSKGLGGPTKVDEISGTLLATPNSQDAIEVDEVARNSVKRNLFGTLPVEPDEPTISKSNPLQSVNFCFYSPIKDEETIPDDVSIHDSVSSALHQLPPLGNGDTGTMVDDNQLNIDYDCYEHDDDLWLENVSCSLWEEQLDKTNQEVGGANSTARTLRRFIVQSIVTRQRMDKQNDESQTANNIPR